MFKKPEDWAKAFSPTINVNKNGYEIRTKVLDMAQNQMWQDYHAKLGAFETSVKKEGDEIVSTFVMPDVPGVDQVLETAQKFYDFVNQSDKKVNTSKTS